MHQRLVCRECVFPVLTKFSSEGIFFFGFGTLGRGLRLFCLFFGGFNFGSLSSFLRILKFGNLCATAKCGNRIVRDVKNLKSIRNFNSSCDVLAAFAHYLIVVDHKYLKFISANSNQISYRLCAFACDFILTDVQIFDQFHVLQSPRNNLQVVVAHLVGL